MPSGCIIHSAGISKGKAGVSVPDCLPSARTRLDTERNPCVWGTLRALHTESDSRRRLGVLESGVKRTSAHMYFEKEMGTECKLQFNGLKEPCTTGGCGGRLQGGLQDDDGSEEEP